ncbi:MAG TPA: sialate O-acetylesterase [Parapedobacter sp.]|uniref:sialate O-acetylesterase n=1 Tax=Parapedobacter sp. TaxID=1958893 RepID=UPI002CD3318D|nr:sialate O-acetylesterase [Parapedobacter sp.]HWK57626.1 sialate O-acetylesterase [Parapedobacter sp.]
MVILLRLVYILALFIPLQAYADLRLPALFSDGMVLQQKTHVAFWGWAAPFEEITFRTDWGLNGETATADSTGRWFTRILTPSAGGPYEIRVCGAEDSTVLKQVLIGEVWLCSGQSNMEFPLGFLGRWKTGVFDYEKEIDAASHPNIRMFQVKRRASATPETDVEGKWAYCEPEFAGDFSAVAYYFAKELAAKTTCPIGIIHASYGGTAIECWMGKNVFYNDTTMYSNFREHLSDLSRWERNRMGRNPSVKYPTVLYNGMIAPLVPFTIKGIAWYQGESNSDRPKEYRQLFPALIENWRNEWNAMLPFYYVQIAPHAEKGPLIREAQLLTLKRVSHTGMAVITDAADSLDIHPRDKKKPGDRLARLALANVYKIDGVCPSGPIYDTMRIVDEKIELSFKYAKGLYSKGGALTEFEICGADRIFVKANATIERDIITVSSNEVDQPIAVRFAWKNFPRPNLYNGADLPASPFRTDDWEH